MFDFLIVGAGYSGCTLAERIATQLDRRVLIVDRRPHIGGFAYDYYNEDGILVHKYGPHAFHTNSQEVFAYLSQFTAWHYYSTKVQSYVDGRFVPFPINMDTINQLYGTNLQSPQEMQAFLDAVKAPIENPQNAEEMVIKQVGEDLYKKFFRNYTWKYWGIAPQELDKSITAHIPPRTNRDDRYNTNTYQTMPKYGFTAMLQKMLAHPKISVLLQTDYRSILDMVKYDRLIYTGSIDSFFDYTYGKLPYRSLRFEHETVDVEYYQPSFIVHYPNDYDFKRVAEFKHATGQKHPKTAIVREYAMDATEGMELCYPIPRPENEQLFKQYRQEAEKLKTVTFAGRLAAYRYYSIAEAVAQALAVFKKGIAPKYN